MRRALLLAALAAAASASCQLVYGLDDFHPTGSTSSGAATEGGGASSGSANAGGSGGAGGAGPAGGAPTCGSDLNACVTKPAAFTGYFHLVASTPELAPDRCASEATPKHFYQDPIAACTSCSCGGAPTPPCSSPKIDSFAMSNCPANGGTKIDQASGNCTPTFDFNVKADAPAPLDCAIMGGTRTADDWKTEVTLCEVATGSDGCASGQDCVPTGEDICILQDNASADCPAGWGAPMVVYADADDTLHCNACSCTPTFNCEGQYLAYQGDANACFSGSTPIVPGNCTAASYVAYEDHPPSGELGCTPTGGGSTGMFVPTSASTICCKMP